MVIYALSDAIEVVLFQQLLELVINMYFMRLMPCYAIAQPIFQRRSLQWDKDDCNSPWSEVH